LEVPTPGPPTLTVHQEGTSVRFDAFRKCGTSEVRTVRVEKHSNRVNESPGVDWLAGIAGGAAVVTGSAFLIDSGNVHEDDTSSRTYNEYGRSTAKTLGFGLLAGGVALSAIPVIDAVRASGSTTQTDEEERTSEPDFSNAKRCTRDAAVAGQKLILRTSRGRMVLGRTGDDGSLSGDLARVVNPDRYRALGMPDRVEVVNDDGAVLGEIDLRAVGVFHDNAAWEAVTTSEDDCRTSLVDSKCADVVKYVSEHPAGKHVSEANEILADHAEFVRNERARIGLGVSEKELVARFRAVGFKRTSKGRNAQGVETRTYRHREYACFMTFYGPEKGPLRQAEMSCLKAVSATARGDLAVFFVVLVKETCVGPCGSDAATEFMVDCKDECHRKSAGVAIDVLTSDLTYGVSIRVAE